VPNEFRQIDWDHALEEECRRIVRLAIDEDLGDVGDLTSRALVPEDLPGRAAVVARRAGVVAGLPAAEVAARMIDPRLAWTPELRDGDAAEPGGRVAVLEGPAQAMLAAERIVLNVLGRLSGIATLTRKYVDAVAGTRARIYDTRKTTPGWRRLEKYAVRCGGGWNHRTGLYDAVLIKDNHLALGAEKGDSPHLPERPATNLRSVPGFAQMGTVPFFRTPAEAVANARRFVESHLAEPVRGRTVIEIEVDTLDALAEVLPAGPDVVLLDNMSPEELAAAVALRDASGLAVQLEASGGVNLATVAAAAASGVDRISIGALTHSAPCLDVGLDWLS
jgi:nicotinate-nucleotide pyrophosphorylase (carboxylating)